MSLPIKEKFKAVAKLLLEPKLLYKLISFRAFGYLLETGWFNSYKLKKPVDGNFDPIPWFTYSAIDFLSSSFNTNLKVLELGSGNSTLFLAKRVGKVISIEHAKNWYQEILEKVPGNVELIYTESNNVEAYLKPLSTKGEIYDVIIIDAIFRNESLKECLKYINEKSVIVFDDTDRKEYSEAITFAKNNGFKQLEFSGIAPGVFFKKCTTILYRDLNCLGI